MRVAVVGGGPAGAVAAMELARQGFEVCVYEREGGPRDHPGDCLSPVFGPLLDRLGLREALETGPHRRVYGSRAVWGSDAPAGSDFLFRRHGTSFRLHRRDFSEMLASAATAAGAAWKFGRPVVECRRRGREWELIAGGEAATADFVIDATGRSAAVARKLSIRRSRLDPLVAIAAEVEGVPAEDSFTLVEAVRCGWWYSGALQNGRLAVFLATDADSAAFSQARTAEGWWRLAGETRHTAERLRGGRIVRGPRVWAAGSERLASIAGEGWLAVGDAAAAHDPVASHGIGAAMGSGYYAARAAAGMARGDGVAQDAYVFAISRAFDAYLLGLSEQYAREQRWPDSRFWARRQGAR